ncbi:hypothetical protein, partial [uncultured Desulfovibrio sp.]|uniref:hypothetical protein n=1 Tax=uncultured Desulfovibrio sp. TaxID=167968 RepID=UPI00260EC4BE
MPPFSPTVMLVPSGLTLPAISGVARGTTSAAMAAQVLALLLCGSSGSGGVSLSAQACARAALSADSPAEEAASAALPEAAPAEAAAALAEPAAAVALAAAAVAEFAAAALSARMPFSRPSGLSP